MENFSVQLGLKTIEACREVGISRSLFYELKNRKREVTSKMEDRLSSAERDAGLAPPLTHDFDRATNFRERLDVIRRASDKEALMLYLHVGAQGIHESRVQLLLSDVEPFLDQSKELADLADIVIDSPEKKTDDFKDFLGGVKDHARRVRRRALELKSRLVDLEKIFQAIKDSQSDSGPESS